MGRPYLRRAPGSTARRGYGFAHQRRRKAWAPKVATGTVQCWRCGELIAAGAVWDLGHDDEDRRITRGPEHQACNRATSKHRAERAASYSPSPSTNTKW